MSWQMVAEYSASNPFIPIAASDPLLHALWIYIIDGIIRYILKDVEYLRFEPYWILSRPPSRLRVIIPRPKPRQLCMLVVYSTGEGEGLEAGIRIRSDVPEFVRIDALCNRAISGTLSALALLFIQSKSL